MSGDCRVIATVRGTLEERQFVTALAREEGVSLNELVRTRLGLNRRSRQPEHDLPLFPGDDGLVSTHDPFGWDEPSAFWTH